MADIRKAARAGDKDFKNRYKKREQTILNAVDPKKRAMVKKTFHAHSEDVERVVTRYQKGVDSGKLKPIKAK